MAILTGMPAQAAQTVQGNHPGFGNGNVSESTILSHAENLTSTLSSRGVDVSGLEKALTDAQNAIQNANSTAFKEAMKMFNQALHADLKNGRITGSGIEPGNHTGMQGNHPGFARNGTFTLTPAMETKELGFAQNLTSTLGSKGIDVSNLNAVLNSASVAIQNSNSTAFKEAMKTFNQDIQSEIKSGVIAQSDLPKVFPDRGGAKRPGFAGNNHAGIANSTQS